MVIINKLVNPTQTLSGFSSFSKALNWVFNFTPNKAFNLLFFSFSQRPQPVTSSVGFEYLKMVMERLKVICGDVEGDVSIQESRLVMEEPRMEELKQAFDEYDENRDGFIDAEELQRVLCGLGLEEGLGVEECVKMIKVADGNGDGLVDFHEFVVFMGTKI